MLTFNQRKTVYRVRRKANKKSVPKLPARPRHARGFAPPQNCNGDGTRPREVRGRGVAGFALRAMHSFIFIVYKIKVSQFYPNFRLDTISSEFSENRGDRA